MWDYRKSAKLSLILTYVFIAALAAAVIFLPALITWYVEVMGRDQNLPTIVMITCYPCVPFAAVMLFSLRALLKNIISDLVFGDENIRLLKRISICCGVASLILLLAGSLYLPFYVAGVSAAACGLIVHVIKNLFETALQLQRKELEYVRENNEENSNLGNR